MVLSEDLSLSVLIPARNEMFLSHTVQDVLGHIKGNTNIIVVLDGAPADPPLPDDPRVQVLELPNSIGQRAAVNEAARHSQAKYVMKLDAHCSVSMGFDVKMMADMQPLWTMTPLMRNLHAFDWVCPDGHRRYQGKSGPCEVCGKETTMDILWIPKTSPKTTSMRFDNNLKFQYWTEYKKRQKGDLVDTMSLVGACWLLERERFWDLEICDEKHGSWGQMGTEVACKTWLSGGRLVCNKKAWFAHLFRTAGGDFGFPYPLSGGDVERARQYSKELWLKDTWPKAIHPLSWLIEKFAPVPDWDIKKRTKGILYYTCNTHDKRIELAIREQLYKVKGDCELGCVSLQPTEFGDWNITLLLQRSPLSMHKQILAGLEKMNADVVFLVESDVLYHPSHFEFTPPRDDIFYFNTNVWKARFSDGHAVWTDDLQQVSGMCASRELLLAFYRRRVAEIERDGFNRHYEPSLRTGISETQNWQSEYPNVDIRHDRTLSVSKWAPSEFRSQQYARGWKETDGDLPGWGNVVELVKAIRRENQDG